MFILSALILPALYLSLRLKKRIEETLAPVMLGAMVLLTALAMVGKLLCVDSLAIAVSALAFVFGIVQLIMHRPPARTIVKDLFAYVLTPGLLCLIAAAVFFWYAAEPMSVWWRDDLAHWGLQVKSLWFFHGLADGAQSLNVRFGDYPPGVQVLQWLMVHAQGAWSERALYFALFTTYAVFLLPLFSRVPWRRAYWLPVMLVFLIAFPTWGNVLSYVFLGIDTSLSLCFGYALLLAWDHRSGEPFSFAAFALALCGMLLIKQIGLLLAVFALVLFTLRTRETHKRILILWVLPFALTGAWVWYCHAMGLAGYNSSGVITQLSAMVAGRYQLPVNADGILPALWNALLNRYCGDITLATSAPVALPLLFWLIVLPLAPLALWAQKTIRAREARHAACWMGATAIVYLLAIYGSFFTTFYFETDVYTYAEQGNMVLLIERYMAPLILGFGMLVIRLFQDSLPAHAKITVSQPDASPRRAFSVVAALFFTALMVVSTNWAVMAEVLNPDKYYQNERSIGSESAVRDQETWGSALDEIPNARVMIDLDKTSDYVKELVYSFAPARFFLSTQENTASTEALSAYLAQNGITQLICLNDESALMQCATPLTEDQTLYSYTLYDVATGDSGLTLTENTD